eukprot:Skav229489  [mRNA]  locus=scaffold4918:196633:198353:- [translate_table: standard]
MLATTCGKALAQELRWALATVEMKSIEAKQSTEEPRDPSDPLRVAMVGSSRGIPLQLGSRKLAVDLMTLAVEISSAVVAGLVIVVVTAIVERLGPVVGGVLGCVPHVAVVGSVGFILQTVNSDEFRIAMLSMPLGMLCNSSWALKRNTDAPPTDFYTVVLRTELSLQL